METILLGSAQDSVLDRLLTSLAPHGDLISPRLFPEFLALYARDAQRIQLMPPLAVFQPSSLDAVRPALQVCAALNLSVTPRCAGTGMTAAAVAAQGGVVMVMSGFHQIQDYDPNSGCCRVAAAVSPKQLNRRVKSDGWCFPCDWPSAGLGACLATGALEGIFYQGAPCLDLVSRAELVTAEGVEWVGADLLSGTEGTSGVITRLDLKLLPKQEPRSVRVMDLSLEEALTLNLHSHLAINGARWCDGKIYVSIAGEPWRTEAAHRFLKGFDLTENLPTLLPKGLLVGSGIPIEKAPLIRDQLQQLADDVGLELESHWHLLRGWVEFSLYADDPITDFRLRIQKFLEAWTNILEPQGGTLCSFRGVGQLYSPYLPAFTGEGGLAWLQGLRSQGLMSRGNQQPIPGKCVERR